LAQKTAQVKAIYMQRDERIKAIAELECTVQDLEDNQDEAEESRNRLVRDLADVEKQIATKEAELQGLLPNLTAIKDEEVKLKQR
jgi:chromosome segregation ATPase